MVHALTRAFVLLLASVALLLLGKPAAAEQPRDELSCARTNCPDNSFDTGSPRRSSVRAPVEYEEDHARPTLTKLRWSSVIELADDVAVEDLIDARHLDRTQPVVVLASNGPRGPPC